MFRQLLISPRKGTPQLLGQLVAPLHDLYSEKTLFPDVWREAPVIQCVYIGSGPGTGKTLVPPSLHSLQLFIDISKLPMSFVQAEQPLFP